MDAIYCVSLEGVKQFSRTTLGEMKYGASLGHVGFERHEPRKSVVGLC